MKKSLRYLGMPIFTQEEWLEKLQDSNYLNHSIDCYNNGELVELLENRIAKLLGKERALFFPKGTVAQFCALKVAEKNKQCDKVILHPRSHIALDEQDAYQSLLGLKGRLLDSNEEPFSFSQVNAIDEHVSSLVVELPLRRVGFKLTPWTELQQMSAHCKAKNIHFHMDGARLWESTEYYQKSLAEISSLFDSVYVSLYKGLGGIGGSVLVGDEKFIEQCKVWRTRFGGDFFTSFPLLISALDGLDNQLEKIPVMVNRALSIATLLSKIPRLKVNTPQTNGFFIFTEGNIKKLNNRAKKLDQKLELKLFNGFNQTETPNLLMAEIQVGAEHQLITNQEVFEYFKQLFAND